MAKILTQIGIETGDFVEAFHVSQSIDAFTGVEDYDITLSGSFTLVNGTQGANKVAVSDANGKIDFVDASTLFSGVASVTGLDTDNTDPLNPIVNIAVDGVTVTGDGTSGNPLVSVAGGVASVTGLDTDNTDPLNPIVQISVDGSTITGDGSIGNPLVAASAGGAVLHTHYAFVDLVNGDDSTATLGNEGLSFLTISAAQAALIAFGVSESQPGCLYLRSGIYTVSVTLKTNIITYCEPGVVFTSGGFIDDVNTVKAVVLGYATFKESALLYNGLFASDIHIEAFELYKMPIPSLYNERCIAHNPTTSVGKAKLTVILEKCTLGNRAQDIAVRGDCDFNFTCKTPVIFYYAITLTAISAGSVNCTGTWIFTAPSWIWKTGGAFGQSFKNALYFQQTDSNFKFTINGDIINEATNTSSQLIQNNQTFGGLVTINGDIDLSIARGIHSHNNSVMTVVFNSKKIKGINGLFDTSATVFNNAGNVVKLFFNSTTFNKLVGTLTNAFLVSLNNEIGFDKCKIIQDDATIDIISVTAITAKLSMIRTDAVLVGGGGYVVNTNGNAVTIALKNCVSNVNISDVLTQKYATNNLEVEPLFTLPIY